MGHFWQIKSETELGHKLLMIFMFVNIYINELHNFISINTVLLCSDFILYLLSMSTSL